MLGISSEPCAHPFPCWEKKFVVVKKCNPACVMPVVRNTILAAFRESRHIRPFVERGSSLLAIRSECCKVLGTAVIVINIKVPKADGLVKLNPFWQIPRGILEC
jgi:hypothetical protein